MPKSCLALLFAGVFSLVAFFAFRTDKRDGAGEFLLFPTNQRVEIIEPGCWLIVPVADLIPGTSNTGDEISAADEQLGILLFNESFISEMMRYSVKGGSKKTCLTLEPRMTDRA